MRLLAGLLFLVSSLGAHAAAQTCVDGAVAELRSADFGAALAALDACEDGASFSVGELARYYETMALVRFGTGDDTAAEQALARLAAVAPAHTFSDEAPPRVRRRFAEIAATVPRPSLHLDATAEGDELVVSADVRDDPGSIVRRVRLFTRSGSGAWSDADGTERRVRIGTEELHYYGVGEALGGAVVAQAGDAQAPLTFVPPASASGALGPTTTEEDDDGGGNTALVVVLVAVAVALVAGGVSLGVVLGTAPRDTQLGTPMGVGL